MLEDYKVENFQMSTIEDMERIMHIMKNSICKISINNGQQGTGFLCRFNINDWDTLRCLVTTDFFIDESDFDPGSKINFSLDEGRINKEITIEENRKKYTNKEYGITFIEIKSKDGIKKESFMEIDENIYDNNPKEYLKRLPVFLLQYPNGDKIKKSEGIILKLRDNNTIEHLCKCDSCSSGGPLINFNNNKIIAIHKDFGNGQQWNLGIFIKAPIEKFKEAINNIENNQNLRQGNNFNMNNNMNNMNMNMNNINMNNINNFMNNMNMNNMNNMDMNNMNMNNMNDMNINNMNMNMNNMNNMDMNNMNMNNKMNNFMNFLNLNHMINNLNLNNNINNMNQNNNMNDIMPNILVKFETSSGRLEKIKVSNNTSIKKLIKIYCKKVGITEKYCGTDIIFLYNGSILDFNSKNKLKSLSNNNQISITIIDKNGLLSKMIDIEFLTASGNKTNIKSSKLISVSELMKLYINIMELEENMIDKNIFFIFNGLKLKFKSKETLNSLLTDEAQKIKIIVIDPKNIIGSKINIFFQTNLGLKTIINSYPFITIENLIKKYKEEKEIDENITEKQLYFLFNGEKLKTNSKETIEERGIMECSNIIVIDSCGITNI